MIEESDHIYQHIKSVYKKNQNKSKKEIISIINKSIGSFNYEKHSYPFILSMDGKSLIHPMQKELESKNLLNHKDNNGNYPVKEMIDILKEKNSSFYEWQWINPTKKDEKEFKKIGYIKRFEPLDIFLGVGVYEKDYIKTLQNEILNYIPKIEFGKNGFIFAVDYEGNMLSYPKANRIGVNIYNAKDANGKYYIKEMIEKAKNKSAFTSYITPNTAVHSNLEKISYSKAYKKWEWVLISGFLIKDLDEKVAIKNQELEKANKEYIEVIFLGLLIIAVILFVISFLVSKEIEKQFFKYKKKIIEESNKNTEKDRIMAQQSKMASLGEMLANIAHQWRQPLSGITTSSSALSLKIEMGILEEKDIIEANKTIMTLAQYLSQTLDNFRNFFKPEKDKKSFHLNKTLDNSLYIAKSELIRNKIEIIRNINNIEIFGYENDMIQVLLNLINNSKDALILNNKNDDKFIFINIYEKDDYVYINIKDNANGIEEDIIEKIFEPYFTTKHTYNGTGIGLYMVKEILNRHMNSDINVKNEEFKYNDETYKGASFTIKFKTERQ